jgi:hypothetical protein
VRAQQARQADQQTDKPLDDRIPPRPPSEGTGLA